MKRAALGAGALTGSGLVVFGLPDLTISKPSAKQDVDILNFALTFEHLSAAFYEEASAKAGLSGELQDFARVVGGHEKEHVAFLEKVLGDKATKAPRFDFRDSTTNADKFAQTAREIEDLGVAAYNGQATNLTPAALRPAARIVSVEARHAAWIRDILEENPAPRASDVGVDAKQASATIDKTRFVL